MVSSAQSHNFTVFCQFIVAMATGGEVRVKQEPVEAVDLENR